MSRQGEWGAADPLGGGQRWVLSVRRPEAVPIAQGVPGAEVEKKPRFFSLHLSSPQRDNAFMFPLTKTMIV